MLIDRVNDREVTSPVAAVLLRELWPELLIGWGTDEVLIDCVNGSDVTDPVVAVWLRVLWPELLIGWGADEALIDCVNDSDVTGPVVAVWLRVLWPALLVDCIMADVVISVLLVACLVPDMVELVLWPILFVCDGADEVAKLLVLDPCVEIVLPGVMVCDVTDERIVVGPMLLVVVWAPVTVAVNTDDSVLLLRTALVAIPVLAGWEGAVEVVVPLRSTVVA